MKIKSGLQLLLPISSNFHNIRLISEVELDTVADSELINQLRKKKDGVATVGDISDLANRMASEAIQEQKEALEKENPEMFEIKLK